MICQFNLVHLIKIFSEAKGYYDLISIEDDKKSLSI